MKPHHLTVRAFLQGVRLEQTKMQLERPSPIAFGLEPFCQIEHRFGMQSLEVFAFDF